MENVSEITKKVVDTPIDTPIAVLIQRTKDSTRDSITQRLNAITKESLLLQYRLREHAVVDWYNELDDKRKALHNFLECNRDVVRNQAKKMNWVLLSFKKLDGMDDHSTMDQTTSKDVFWSYFNTYDVMVEYINGLLEEDTSEILCEPLFVVN